MDLDTFQPQSRMEELLWILCKNSMAGGQNGKSAYEIAVEQGFEGTVDEWLKSLIGAAGAKGSDGKTPVRGTDYWTDADIQTIKDYVDSVVGGA